MKVFKAVTALILIVIIISGCKAKNEEITLLKIPNVDKYTVLYIQGVDKRGTSSESTSKYITNKQLIQDFIEQVNNIEVIKPTKRDMFHKVKELSEPGNYTFVLSDSIKLDNKVYYMNIYKDGSIQFQHTDKKELAYLSREKYPKKVEEFKKNMGIDF